MYLYTKLILSKVILGRGRVKSGLNENEKSFSLILIVYMFFYLSNEFS